MALIKCPECGKEISDKAKVCIQCGYPIAETMGMETNNVDEELVLEPISDWNSEDNILLDCKRGKYIKIEDGILEIKMGLGGYIKDYIYNFSLQYYAVSMGYSVGLSILNESKGFYTGVLDFTTRKNVTEFNRFRDIMKKKNLFQNRSRFDEIYKRTETEKRIAEEKRQAYSAQQHEIRIKQQEQDMVRQQQQLMKQQEKVIRNMAKCPRCGSTSISYDTKKLSVGRAIVGDAVAGPTGAILGGLSSKKGYGVCLKCGKRWKL